MTKLAQEMLSALETGSISVIELLQEIDLLAKKDSLQAEQLLIAIKEKTNLTDNILVKYLHNKIREERQNLTMSDEEKAINDKYLDVGRNYFKSKQYEEALRTFKTAYHDTNNSIFLYYLGKTYFRMSNMTLSYKYFTSYIDMGYENFTKACFYLWVQFRNGCKSRHIKNFYQAVIYYIPEIFSDEEPFSYINKMTPPGLELILPTEVEVKTTCWQQMDGAKKETTCQKQANDVEQKNEEEKTSLFSQIISENNEEARLGLFCSLDFYDRLSIIEKMYSIGYFS